MSLPEQAKAAPKASSSGRVGDKILMGSGIALAAAAAFFPWYVFFNEDKFGLRTNPMDHTRDLPPSAARQVFSVSPLAMVDRTKDESLPMDPTDALTTATVSSLGSEEDGGLPQDQPMPGKGGFRLLHVANGRALIEDGSGMYMVRIGSILPDNSKVATLEKRDDRWVIVTSTGEIYRDQQATEISATP